jgi:rhamnogalacturonan acetylesterase
MQKKYVFIWSAVVTAWISFSFSQQDKPTLYLIGDSTVRNGAGRGDGGLWGWGHFIGTLLDTNKLHVQNNAMGGTSSRSYWALGLWDKTQRNIKPGDIVLIQFGHNDNGPTTLKGTGNDSMEVISPVTKQPVMAHSFGWNIRKYIRETKSKGGTPVVLTLVPRNLWKDGEINRVGANFVQWSREVATEEAVDFIDLNKIIADHYDELGQEKVSADFFTAKDYVHTNEVGARFNAQCVTEGLQTLPNNPLKKYALRSR